MWFFSSCADLPAFHNLRLKLSVDCYPLLSMVRGVWYVASVSYIPPKKLNSLSSARHHPTRHLG